MMTRKYKKVFQVFPRLKMSNATNIQINILGNTYAQINKIAGAFEDLETEAFKLLAWQISVDKIGIDGLKELQKQTILLSQAGDIDLGFLQIIS